ESPQNDCPFYGTGALDGYTDVLAGLHVSVAAVSIQCCRRRQCRTGRLAFHGLRCNSAGGCSRMDPDLAHRGRRTRFHPDCGEAEIRTKGFGGYSYRETALRRSFRLDIRSTERMTSIDFWARVLPRTFSERVRNFFPRIPSSAGFSKLPGGAASSASRTLPFRSCASIFTP